MPDPVTKLRVVGAGEPPLRRRKGPGLAVVLVALYAVAFAAALWLLRGEALRERGRTAAAPSAPRAAKSARPKADREALLSGAGLEPAARSEYERQLASECCDCGCDLTLHECLVRDQKCSRSAEICSRKLAGLK
ncbi:MAG: hypothetical protein ACM3SU_18400 [Acidobacteriota bacterium]